MLEAVKHPASSFLTLTYSEEKLPNGGTLVPSHLSDFVKRLRYHSQLQLRYFGVGEYGERSWRPHYHLCLFGMGPERSAIVDKAWGQGFTHCGDLTFESAQYVAGYTVKKLTSPTDPKLNGRYPEFARMSLKPGIGAIAVSDLVNALDTEVGWDEMVRNDDVPTSLKHGGRTYPLGRYLRVKLREALGIEGGETREQAFQRQAEVLALYKDFEAAEKGPEVTFNAWLEALSAARTKSIEKRYEIYNSRKYL